MDFEYASLQRKATIYNILAVAALGLFLLFLGYALYEVRINGPLYDHIRRDHDLVADALPPPLYIVDPHLDVTAALLAAEQGAFDQSLKLVRRGLQGRAAFDDRMAFWAQSIDSVDIRDMITQQARKPAARYFDVVEQSLLPALARHDVVEARKVYDSYLVTLFQTHRLAIERATDMAHAESIRTEAEAANLVKVILAGVLACGALLGAIWWWSFQRWWIRPLLRRTTDVGVALARIGGGDYTTPVAVGAPDEFGQILGAIESMRTHLRVAVQELDDKRIAAQAGERAKAEFLANMSHEIRTPMNAILGLTDLALRSHLTDQQRGWLTKSNLAAHALLDLLDQILDLANPDASSVRLEIVPFELHNLLDRITAKVSGKAQQKGLTWRIHAEPGTPAKFRGDAHRIEQVLVNLVDNAIKFTDKGQVAATVALQEQDADQCLLRFTVRDSGIGMTHAQMGQLFKPFAQVDASLARRQGGAGLGLVICQKWVQAMGGTLSVSSTLGQGSEFSFTLPLAVASDESALPAPLTPTQAMPSSPPPEWAALHGKRVLLVEDNDINQLVASELLHDVAGMDVMVADGGLAALVLLQSHAFDVVLMDIQMPGLDGYETTRRLRAMGLAADHLPVIAMTAHTTEHDRAQCLAAGMNDYISKPVMPAALFAMIQTWISR
ncbi:MAG: response regulator [Burkholderiales bacterium]|nr:response regulator [Burkholderiales bacterium]